MRIGTAIGALAAFTLLVLAHGHVDDARAQERPVVIGAVYNIGLAPGQFLRLVAFNPHPADAGAVHFHVHGTDGTRACHSGPIAVRPLETVFIDIPRESPHLAGLDQDPTGRVQLGIVAAVTQLHRRGGEAVPSVVPSVELVDAASGRSTGGGDSSCWIRVGTPWGQQGSGSGGGVTCDPTR